MKFSRYFLFVMLLFAVVWAESNEDLEQKIKDYEGYEKKVEEAPPQDPEEKPLTEEERVQEDLKELEKDIEKPCEIIRRKICKGKL